MIIFKIIVKHSNEEFGCKIAEYENIEESIKRFHKIGTETGFNINANFEVWLINYDSKIIFYKKITSHNLKNSDLYLSHFDNSRTR